MKKFNQSILVTRPYLPPLEEFKKGCEEIWANQWLTNNGPMLQRFQAKLADYLQVPETNLALFNNGTLALELGYYAMGLAGGDVITTPFTFVATSHALKRIGATPIFADIDPTTLCLDPAACEKLVTPRTKAIVPVHVYGNLCDIEGFNRLSQKYGIPVIYDAAHAFGVQCLSRGVFESLSHRVDESLSHRVDESLSHRVDESLSHRVDECLSSRPDESFQIDSKTQRLKDSNTPRLQDSKTQTLQDSKTLRLKDSNTQTIGTCGDLSMFSFHPTKLFHSCEGGCLVFKDPALQAKLFELRNFAIHGELSCTDVGSNAKMNELQALMGLCCLEKIDELLAWRHQVAATYAAAFAGTKVHWIGQSANDAYCPVLFDSFETRERVYTKLMEMNVYSRRYFYPLLTDFAPYIYAKGTCPIAADISSRVLTLPTYYGLDLDDVRGIAENVLECLSL